MSDELYEVEHIETHTPQPSPLNVGGKPVGGVDSTVIKADASGVVNTSGIPKGKAKINYGKWPQVSYESSWSPPSISDNEDDKSLTKPKDKLLFQMLKGMSQSRVDLLKKTTEGQLADE
jgi:hypothetical protein